MKLLLPFVLLGIMASGCKNQSTLAQKSTSKTTAETTMVTGPDAIVYKTNKNYNDKVPVTLSADGQKIVAYPAPSDLDNAAPTPLINNYLLDNRGVGPNTAFLSLTYSDYQQLKEVSVSDLQAKILDKDPFTELYNCGPRHRFKDAEKELNQIIKEGKLSTQCRLIDG